MEEILASIRRIISEDDAPAGEAAPAEEPAEEETVAEEIPIPPEEEDDGVLELTEKVETHGDLDVYATTTSEPEPEPAYTPPPQPTAWADDAPDVGPGEGLVGDPAAAAAAAAFGALSSQILMPRDGRTLEDVVEQALDALEEQEANDG